MNVPTNSLLPTWIVEGDERSSLGFFRDRVLLPVPGDHVVMFPGEEDEHEVVVTHRTFEQPEKDRPFVRIYARRVVDAVELDGAIKRLAAHEKYLREGPKGDPPYHSTDAQYQDDLLLVLRALGHQEQS